MIWSYPIAKEMIKDCLPAQGVDASKNIETINQYLYGACMQPPITIGYTCDFLLSSPSPASGKRLAFSHPFILPYIGGSWKFHWKFNTLAPSGTSPLYICEWDYDYWTSDLWDTSDDSYVGTEIWNDVNLVWPLKKYESQAAITSPCNIQMVFSSWDEYEVSGYDTYKLADRTTSQFPPYVINEEEFPLGAVTPKKLAEWCNALLYTPLYLWGHNSAPKNNGNIGTGTIRYGTSASNFSTPVGYVSQQMFKLCHWVPYRWGCPDFCNTLHIYVLSMQTYNDNVLSPPVIRVSIAGQEYEKTMDVIMTSEDDGTYGFFYVYKASFPPPTGLETSTLIGGRPFWPVQVIKFLHLNDKGSSVTTSIQSCAAWIGGRP